MGSDAAMRGSAIAWVLACFACSSTTEAPAPAVDGSVPCAVRGERCGNAPCCGVLECNGEHVCTDGTCFDKGAYCASNVDCCGALGCTRGLCTDGLCMTDGAHCGANIDCCNGSCVKGNCSLTDVCFGKGQGCTIDADCCGELTCEDGGCFDWACVYVGSACASSN